MKIVASCVKIALNTTRLPEYILQWLIQWVTFPGMCISLEKKNGFQTICQSKLERGDLEKITLYQYLTW